MTMNGAQTRNLDGAAGGRRWSIVRRDISYLRVSVTDRCDFRCVYCMSENMPSCPRPTSDTGRARPAVLRLRRARRPQASPHRRRAAGPARHHDPRQLAVAALHSGALDELTLTTNGSQLAKYAAEIKAAGVRRLNVIARYAQSGEIPRHHALGFFGPSAAGIDAALAAGLKIKIKQCRSRRQRRRIPATDRMDARPRHGFDADRMMPLCEIDEGRLEQYLPLSIARARLSERFSLADVDYRTGGPGAMSASPRPADCSASSRR